MLWEETCQTSKSEVMQADKSTKWLLLHSIWLRSNERSQVGGKAPLSLIPGRNDSWIPAAAVVRYWEVEKEVFQDDLCHPYSCCVVLNYLDAAFPKPRLNFPRHRFHPDFFPQMQAKDLFTICPSDSRFLSSLASQSSGDRLLYASTSGVL